MFLTGVFATKTVNAGGNNGLFYGNPAFFFTQLKGLAIVITYSFSMSYGIFKFINWVMPMRVSEADEEMGLDATQHDENYLQGTLLLRHSEAAIEEELPIDSHHSDEKVFQASVLLKHNEAFSEEFINA
jgi:Amt family ammonium transporter